MKLKDLKALNLNYIQLDSLGELEVVSLLMSFIPNSDKKPTIEVTNFNESIASERLVKDIRKVIENLVELYTTKVKNLLEIEHSISNMTVFSLIKRKIVDNILNSNISCSIEEKDFWLWKKPIIVIRPMSYINTQFPEQLFQTNAIEDLRFVFYQITITPKEKPAIDKLKTLIVKN